MHNIKAPIGNRLLVEAMDIAPFSTILHMPATKQPAMNAHQRSKVLKVGTRCKLVGKLKEGDIVLHNNQMGFPVPDTNQRYLLLHADDVLAIESTAMENDFFSAKTATIG